MSPGEKFQFAVKKALIIIDWFWKIKLNEILVMDKEWSVCELGSVKGAIYGVKFENEF